MGANWAQIAVNAPLAWGCTTGSQPGESPPTIAIVDNGFYDIADLRGNLGPVHEFAPSPLEMHQHGTLVAAIAGAVGGNDSGMTGMLWHARMNLVNNYNPIDPLDTTFNTGAGLLAVQKAIESGPRVINISWGIDPDTWPTGHPKTPDDLVKLKNTTDLMRFVVYESRDRATGRYPILFVVSAGNNQAPAYEDGWPSLAADTGFGKVVLAVASTYRSSSSTQGFDESSNSGPLVEIAAPGDQVASLDSTGSVVTVGGTSFAAPLVTGAAGLLFAFDPALTPDSVKKLLIDGANLNPRFVSGPFDVQPKPILDVYASLQLAARRDGAPLCGNRVYSDSIGNVIAERGPSAQPQQIFTSADAPYTDLLNSLHGGRRIQIGDYMEYKWSPTTRTWGPSTFDGNYHEDAGGAFLSWYDGSDHDATRYLIANGFPYQGSVYFTPQLTSLPSFTPLGAMSQVIRPVRNAVGAFACTTGAADSLVTDVGCGTSGETFIGKEENPQDVYALAPQGDFALVGINYRFQSQSYAQIYSKSGTLIPTTDNMRDTSVSIELWRVDSLSLHENSRQATQVKLENIPVNGDGYSRDGLEIAWLAIDETGTELVWELQKRFSDYTGNAFTCTNRVIEYRALKGHAPNSVAGIQLPVEEGTLLRQVQLPNLNRKCTSSFGPATFTPYRGSVAVKGKGFVIPTSVRGSKATLRIQH
jgi:hypothetical protein